MSTIWYLLLLFGFALAGLLWYVGRQGKSLPHDVPRAAGTLRCCEALSLALIGGAMLMFLALYRHVGGVPMLFADDVPSALKTLQCQQLALGVAGLAVAVVLAYRRFVTTAVLGLAALFTAGGFVVNQGSRAMPERTRQAIERTPIPLQIHLSDDVRGADVWVNGQHLGVTPIRTSVEDLLAKVPDWEKVPATPPAARPAELSSCWFRIWTTSSSCDMPRSSWHTGTPPRGDQACCTVW